MSVNTVDPKKPAISITQPACKHLQQQIEKREAIGLRLSVNESGCNGLKYVLDFIEQVNPDDTQISDYPGIELYVARDALAYVMGTEIDYVTENLNHSLKFTNPNAAAECGCGESFSV